MIGKTISHYRVVNQLGAGGMGVVYGADDTRLGRQVALKFIPEDWSRDRQAVERFRVEARTTSALNHPNICTVYDIGEHEGQPFIVMEWMKGQTLLDRLAGGMLKVHQIVDFGIDIADALDAAHAQGIVHRDIKPANIFLTERGHVKVMDFGLAKLLSDQDVMLTSEVEALTQPGMTLGTASYMSPEQAAGDPFDGRSDLFSLGIVLYECATGRRPFVGNSARAVLSAILHTAPMAPGLFNQDLPQRLQQVISDCLEKDPDLRYQNAASLRADLKRVKRDLESGRTGSVTPASDLRTTADIQQATDAHPGANRPPEPTVADSGRRHRRRQRVVLRQRSSLHWRLARSSRLRLDIFGGPELSTRPKRRRRFPRPRLSCNRGSSQRSGACWQSSTVTRKGTPTTCWRRRRIMSRPGPFAIRPPHSCGKPRRTSSRRDSMIQAGDVRGAVRALDEARTLDPVAPGLAEVSQLMAERFKSQAEAAELELQRSRAAAPVPRAAAPAATSSPPTPSTTASAPQVPAEPPREPATPALPPAPPPAHSAARRAAGANRTDRIRRSQTGAFAGGSTPFAIRRPRLHARPMTTPPFAASWPRMPARSNRRISRSSDRSSPTSAPTRNAGSSKGFARSRHRKSTSRSRRLIGAVIGRPCN